jgi:hypothetical protein
MEAALPRPRSGAARFGGYALGIVRSFRYQIDCVSRTYKADLGRFVRRNRGALHAGIETAFKKNTVAGADSDVGMEPLTLSIRP